MRKFLTEKEDGAETENVRLCCGLCGHRGPPADTMESANVAAKARAGFAQIQVVGNGKTRKLDVCKRCLGKMGLA